MSNGTDTVQDAAQTSGSDFASVVADLTGAEPQGQPAAQPEPEAAKAPEVAPEASAQPSAPTNEPAPKSPSVPAPTEPKVTAAPEPQVVSFDGRKYTAAELADAITKDPAFAARLVTRAEQMPHYQQKYQEVLEEYRRNSQQAPPPQPTATPEQQRVMLSQAQAQLTARYGPIAQQMAEQGLIEPEVVAAFPNTVVQMLAVSEQNARLQARLDALEGGVSTQRAEAIREDFSRHFNSMTDEIAKSSPIFADLGDGKVRGDFLGFLAQQVGVTVAAAKDPEFVKAQFLAFKAPTFMADMTAAQKRAQDEEAQKVKNAAGSSRGVRPAAAPPSPGAPWQDLIS